MLINEHNATSTSKVLLVPYCKHHVPQYHTWMQNPAIQKATSSEPLTIAQEHAMQASWRKDADKLTFIICQPVPQSACQHPGSVVQHEMHDSPEQMIGDVNLFLSVSNTVNTRIPRPNLNNPDSTTKINPSNRDLSAIVDISGELELMVPSPENQRHGYGRAALLTFLRYILTHQSAIVTEFLASQRKPSPPLHDTVSSTTTGYTTTIQPFHASTNESRLHLIAKISQSNTSSLSLFQSLGFAKTSEEPNYFGEFELGLWAQDAESPGVDVAFCLDDVSGMMARWGVEDYQELGYVRSTD